MSWPVLIAFAALLCVLIVLPMSWLVYYSVVDKDGAFTLANFATLLTEPEFRAPMVHHADPRDQRQHRLLPRRGADGLAGGAHRPAVLQSRCARW